jgi:hypothetical protein
MRGERTKILTFAAPRSVAEDLRALADERDRSVSAEIRLAVSNHLLLSGSRGGVEVVASRRGRQSSRGPGGS